MVRRFLAALALIAVVAGCSAAALPSPSPSCDDPSAPPCLNVLFVGNSYTYVNDLPGHVAAVAAAGGHRLRAVQLATGGATLAMHLADPATATTLASRRWDVVVLQEQSEVPAIPADRRTLMAPAASSLVRMVRSAGARPVFLQTWAHRDGLPDDGLPDYEAMQRAIDEGYAAAAGQTGSDTAPVGDAWRIAVRAGAGPGLWQEDGSHPALAGTYLAACVLYATIFGVSPVGLPALDGIAADQARALQQDAAAATTAPGG